MTLRANLLHLADLYCAATGLSRQRVSTIVLNAGHRFDKIANGGGVLTDTYERSVDWFDKNWPEKAVWPCGVERPKLGADVPPAAPAGQCEVTGALSGTSSSHSGPSAPAFSSTHGDSKADQRR